MSDRVPLWAYGYHDDLLDEYLESLLKDITEEQKAKLPDHLLVKIFRGASVSINTLTDGQKDYILWKVFNKRIIKVIENNEEGMTIEQYVQARNSFHRKSKGAVTGGVAANNMKVEGMFVQGAADLIASLSYFNIVSHSATYRLLFSLRKRNKSKSKKNADVSNAAIHLVRMIANYESKKKRISMEHGINLPEWYLLMYFYDGEKRGGTAANEKYVYAYSSNKTGMVQGLIRLHREGYLERRGAARSTTYSLTPKGKEVVDKIITKIILNY